MYAPYKRDGIITAGQTLQATVRLPSEGPVIQANRQRHIPNALVERLTFGFLGYVKKSHS